MQIKINRARKKVKSILNSVLLIICITWNAIHFVCSIEQEKIVFIFSENGPEDNRPRNELMTVTRQPGHMDTMSLKSVWADAFKIIQKALHTHFSRGWFLIKKIN